MSSVRNSFASGKTKNVQFRIQQLKNLLRFYNENAEKILDAVYKDLRKVILFTFNFVSSMLVAVILKVLWFSCLGILAPKHSKYIMHFTQHLIWFVRWIFFCYVFYSRLTKTFSRLSVKNRSPVNTFCSVSLEKTKNRCFYKKKLEKNDCVYLFLFLFHACWWR